MSVYDPSVCSWCTVNPTMYAYHNNEWGIPIHDDSKHFEFLVLEVMQCGLNWMMILKKREIIRQVFADYDVKKVAEFTQVDIDRAMSEPQMIHSINKIKAVIKNANIFIELQDKYGSFDNWLWSYTENKTFVYESHKGFIPVKNKLSDTIAVALKRLGVKYLGSITIYSHLQAAGLINDHDRCCRMYEQINKISCIKRIEDEI